MTLVTENNEMSNDKHIEIPQQNNSNEAEKTKKAAKKTAVAKTKKAGDPSPALNIEKTVQEEKALKSEEVKKEKTTKKTVSKKAAPKPVTAKKETVKENISPAIRETQKKETAQPKKKAAAKKTEGTDKVKLTFVLRFHSNYGQTLYISGNSKIFGNNDPLLAMPMQYLSEEIWTATIELGKDKVPDGGITYNYLLRLEDGSLNYDWGKDKKITKEIFNSEEVLIVDSWNFAGYFENVFYTEPFSKVLLKNNFTAVDITASKNYTHEFKVKTPLLQKGETLCILGSNDELGAWDETKALLMSNNADGIYYSAKVNLSKTSFPIYYKYAVYDIAAKKVKRYEDGKNRVFYDAFVKNKKTIVNDGFAVLPSTSWKAAGVAIPVFSLRSENSFGVGDFSDLKLLVDWAKKTGLKLVQILPVNDTTATNTWTDSYPYAAISAFALHPMFLDLRKAAGEKNKQLADALQAEQQRLNKLEAVDYEAVNSLKWKFIQQLYPLQKEAVFNSADYKDFFETNKDWLVPYSVFCYLRDIYKTADFNKWPAHNSYDETAVAALLNTSAESYNTIALHFFVQFHLHLQLKEATQYAHDNGIIVKGDIPIGVYRYGADAWQNPELYHMDMQAGAPPDDFAVTGQNWGFPTYNWEKMKENGFAWWKQRFEQMSYYFDAFRIDHILGFFRIWSIPVESVEGIMGHFEPAIPVHINEFGERNIWFDHTRFCKPFITEDLLNESFGDQKESVKRNYLIYDGFNRYHMKPEYATQRQIENAFAWYEDNEHNRWLKTQLFSLLSNVIFFEAEGSNGKQFHFRFAMENTYSFKHLDAHLQYQLRELYVDYFFRRQDHFWMEQAMQKLPALKRATNMLVCGEDLGLVPGCVPEVMRQLGILSLEIQRMPKDPQKEFFHPADAPFLSVVTPSTHDMSTIRGWWEEDRNLTQRFFNEQLGQWGYAPYFCDAWVNKAVVVQHLYSPAMWSIFQLQDILGSDRKLRRLTPHEERINVPANPKHYWKYRMHLTLEDLIKADEFNNEFAGYIKESGRA